MTRRLVLVRPPPPKPSATAAPDLTIQVEQLYDIAQELPPLFVSYGREFPKVEGVVSDPDWPQLLRMAALGALKVLTARDDGVLVGFAFSVVGPHLMYRSVIHGITNAIWLDPAYRAGWFPVRFLRANLDMLRDAGCRRVCIGHDAGWPRLGKVFERLGYKCDEVLYAQVLT